MLQVEHLNQYYGSSHTLRGVSLTVEKGQCMALLGRNGVGKTTLLKCLMGVLPVARGTVKVIRLERQVRIAAGSLVLLGFLLGWFVNRGFFGLSGLVGAGLIFAGVTDFCGMGLLLACAPWNKLKPA